MSSASFSLWISPANQPEGEFSFGSAGFSLSLSLSCVLVQVVWLWSSLGGGGGGLDPVIETWIVRKLAVPFASLGIWRSFFFLDFTSLLSVAVLAVSLWSNNTEWIMERAPGGLLWVLCCYKPHAAFCGFIETLIQNNMFLNHIRCCMYVAERLGYDADLLSSLLCSCHNNFGH